MDVITQPPNGATFERRGASVKAPGPPGSLTSGSVEERGHQLVITAPPATKFVFEATLHAKHEVKAAVARGRSSIGKPHLLADLLPHLLARPSPRLPTSLGSSDRLPS